MPEHSIDLGAGNSQPCNMMTGLQCNVTLSFDLSIDQLTTPAVEPGPSNVLHLCPVFDMGPDSEVEGNEEGNDKLEGSGGGDCVCSLALLTLVKLCKMDGKDVGPCQSGTRSWGKYGLLT